MTLPTPADLHQALTTQFTLTDDRQATTVPETYNTSDNRHKLYRYRRFTC